MVATVASIDVTLRLLGADSFQSQMRSSGSVSEQTGTRVKRSMDGIAGSTERLVRSAEGVGRTATSLGALSVSIGRADTSVLGLTRNISALNAVVGALGVGVAANAFKNYADTATTIANRLAAVVPVQGDRLKIDQQIFDTAQRTRTSYEATANIYSRLSLSASQLGASQSQILRVVETTQKALVAGGATSSEAASIATQLSQALGSGRLAGDELKSIAENSPVLIQAIAKEFGVAVGALKDMGANGELTADRVFRAILKAGAEVDEVFARTTPTIAAGIQQIDNALTRYIGNVDKSLGATKALTNALGFVAENISGIGDSVAVAMAAIAGGVLGRGATGVARRAYAPFQEARQAAQDRVRAAKEAAEAAEQAFDTAQSGYLGKRLSEDLLRGNPAERVADKGRLREVEASERALKKTRDELASATEDLTKVEARHQSVLASGVEANRAERRAAESAARKVGRRQDEVAQATMDYVNAGGAAIGAQGALPRGQAERLEREVAERTAAAARLAEIDAAIAASRVEADTLRTPTAGPRVQQKAQRVGLLEQEIRDAVQERQRLAEAIEAADRNVTTKEQASASALLAAKRAHVEKFGELGQQLVEAERAVVAQRTVVAARNAAITGRTASGRAQDPETVIKLIDSSIRAEERLESLEAKRDRLARSHRAVIEEGPSLSKSLQKDLAAIESLKQDRERLMGEMARVDEAVVAKRQARDTIEDSISERSLARVARDAENARRAAALDTGADALSAERAQLAQRLPALDASIAQAEEDLATRTAAAQQKQIDGAEKHADRLRKLQGALVKDLEALNTARAAVSASEVLQEEEKQRRLAAIEAQAVQRRQQIAKLQETERDLVGATGIARERLDLNAKGKRSDASAETAGALAQVVVARKAADDAVAQIARAERAASTVALLQSVAGKAVGAFGGLVGLLGGPFGAAITAAAVAWTGYELYQARATAQVEEHKAAVDKLIESKKRLDDLNSRGQVRTLQQQVEDRANVEGARSAERDSRNALVNRLRAAQGAAAQTGEVVLDPRSGPNATRNLTTIDEALRTVGTTAEAVRSRLVAGGEGGAQAAKQLADALASAALKQADLLPLSQEVSKLAEDLERARNAGRDFDNVFRRLPTPEVIDNPLDYVTRAPTFTAAPAIEAVKAQIKEIKGEILSLNDTDISIRGIDTSREQIAQFAQDIVEARANAMQGISGQYVATEINDLVQAFGNGKISVEDYAAGLQELAQRFPSFQPLIEGLTESAQKALADSAAMAELGSQVKGLDGLVANILVKIGVQGSLPKIAADAAIEAGKADAALNKVEAANRVLTLKAAGKDVEAKVLEAQQANPALDTARAQKLYAEQDRLNDQIAANRKAARGGKSKDQRDAESLEKKLRELDQDARVASLNDFDQKTVRFAQSAKVASEQIEAFINAARLGDLSSVPPVMQEIYEKMRLLEGVKLGKASLDEIFPGRLLTEQLESVRRAAATSPEIAANLDLIEQRMRAKSAPEWAKDFTTSFTDMVKGVAAGTATMADALATFKTRVMSLALDMAFKPLERMMTGFLGKGGDGLDGISGLFSSMFDFGGGAGGSPTGGVRLFAEGGIVSGPGTGTSDSIIARVSNGEAIIPARVVATHGPLVKALVSDRLPKFADGRMPDLGALAAASMDRQDIRMGAAPSPRLQSDHGGGMVTEVTIVGGDKTGAETTMGPRGPRTDIQIDKAVAAALMSGDDTRKALKKLTGNRMVG